jgi:soluble lytic murein transglycosylase-like protein
MPVVPRLTYSVMRTAPLDVALVFGRAPGCSDAGPEVINAVAFAAVKAGIEPKVFAALVAVESGCNQYAISPRGAIGYTQVMPRVWKESYDFADRYNLLNQQDNLHVGATIAADLIYKHGVYEGLHRYNGLGDGCSTCDAGYTGKIIALSGRRP